MADIIRNFQRGVLLTAKDLQSIKENTESNQVNPSGNLQYIRGPGGTAYYNRKPILINKKSHAFQIKQTKGWTSVAVSIAYGIVGSGSIKAQVDGVDIDATTTPELTMISGTNVIYLEVTTTTATGSTIASAGVQIDVAATLPTPTSTKGYKEIGRVIVSGTSPNLTAKIYQAVYHSQGYEKGVGTGHYFWSA